MEEELLQEPHGVYWRLVDHFLQKFGIPHPRCSPACVREEDPREARRSDADASPDGRTHARLPTARRELQGAPFEAIVEFVAGLLRERESLLLQLWYSYVKLINYMPDGDMVAHSPLSNAAQYKSVLFNTGLTRLELARLHWLMRAATRVGVHLTLTTLLNNANVSQRLKGGALASLVPVVAPPPCADAAGGTQVLPAVLFGACPRHPAFERTLLLYQQTTFALDPEHELDAAEGRTTSTAHSPLLHIPTLTWYEEPHARKRNTLYALLPQDRLHGKPKLGDGAEAGAQPGRVAEVATLSKVLLPEALGQTLVNVQVMSIDVVRIANSARTEIVFTVEYTPASQRVQVPSLSRAGGDSDPQRHVLLVSGVLPAAVPTHPLAVARWHPKGPRTSVHLTFSYNMQTYYRETANQVARVFIVELDDCKLASVPQIVEWCEQCLKV